MVLGAGDCERLHDGLIAQPVNTASALAYVAVGAWVVSRSLGRGAPPDRRRLAFGLAVAAAGIGSVDYHGPGSPAARLLHDGGLYLVVGFVAATEAARLARRPPPGRRTASPWCDPDSLFQPHAAWHLLGAAALGAWGLAVLVEADSSR